MRQLRKNKQKMYYSVRLGNFPVYRKDKDGNIESIEVDGELVPVPTGEYENGYDVPIEFNNNISGSLNALAIQPYGTDASHTHAIITADKDELPFNVGTRIWLKSEVKYKDIGKTIVDADSADYEVRDVDRTHLEHDSFYLVPLNHEDVVANEP